MPLPTEVLELLQTPITVERFIGRDDFGNAIYGAPEIILSQIDVITRRRGSPAPLPDTIGTPVEVTSRIIVDYGNFGPYDKVTLPNGRTPTVITVDTRLDEDGTYYYQQFIVEENRK